MQAGQVWSNSQVTLESAAETSSQERVIDEAEAGAEANATPSASQVSDALAQLGLLNDRERSFEATVEIATTANGPTDEVSNLPPEEDPLNMPRERETSYGPKLLIGLIAGCQSGVSDEAGTMKDESELNQTFSSFILHPSSFSGAPALEWLSGITVSSAALISLVSWRRANVCAMPTLSC